MVGNDGVAATTGQDAAVEVMLLLAEADARWEDYGSALRVLDMVTKAVGAVPAEYELKRARWARLHQLRGGRFRKAA
jgi:hypothetical protein